MFKIESLGISEGISETDKAQIKNFDDGIKLIDGKYHVDLPWLKNVAQVENNFTVCKAVLANVVSKLKKMVNMRLIMMS